MKGYEFDKPENNVKTPCSKNVSTNDNYAAAGGQNFDPAENNHLLNNHQFNYNSNFQHPRKFPQNFSNNNDYDNFNAVPNQLPFNPNNQNFVNPPFPTLNSVPHQTIKSNYGPQNNQIPVGSQNLNSQSHFPGFSNFQNLNSHPSGYDLYQNDPQFFNNNRIPAFNKINLKFSGSGQSLHSFLEKVEEFSLSHRISKEHLLNFAHEFFEGDALIWYRSVRGCIFGWNDLIYRLRLDFLPIDYEVALWDEVRARTQGNTERPLIYIAIMENLFKRFINPVDEINQLRLIMRNLLPYYQQQLVLRQPCSISELKNLCRILEDTRIRSELFQGPPQCNASTLEPELAYISNTCLVKGGYNHFNRHQNLGNKVNKVHTNEINIRSIPESLLSPNADNSVNSSNLEDHTNVNPNVDALNLASTKCWNCNEMGHTYHNCKLKRDVFCFGCGKKNIIRPKCIVCKSKNATQATLESEGVVTK